MYICCVAYLISIYRNKAEQRTQVLLKITNTFVTVRIYHKYILYTYNLTCSKIKGHHAYVNVQYSVLLLCRFHNNISLLSIYIICLNGINDL